MDPSVPFVKENKSLKAETGIILHFGQQAALSLHLLKQCKQLKHFFSDAFCFHSHHNNSIVALASFPLQCDSI